MIKQRNFVAKYAQRSGVGTHASKAGKQVSRAKIKQRTLKEIICG